MPAVDADITRFLSIGQGFWEFNGPRTMEVFTSSGFTSQGTLARRHEHPHFMGSGVGLMRVIGGVYSDRNGRFPTPLVPRSSLYFYKVGTIGLLHHSEHFIEDHFETNATPQYGMFAVCLPTGNTPLPYLRVDAEPVSGLSGAYGMQILDGAGAIAFDSRSQFLAISEVRLITSAQIATIIDNNAVIDLTLRTAVPGCYIAAPNHTSFFFVGANGQYRHVKIEQTSDTNIRLSRHFHGPPIGRGFPNFGVSNTLVLVIARDPFA